MRAFRTLFPVIILFALQATAAAAEPDVIYVPTPQTVVHEMLRAAGVSSDDVVYDLGSGDGRIVIMAAKRYGSRGVGIDIDRYRIAEARENARAAGVSDRVRFVEGNLFAADLREATVVTLYLLPKLNRRLIPKLYDELRPGTPVVSHDFDMGDWRPDRTIHIEDTEVYRWTIPANVAGQWNLELANGSVPLDLLLDQHYQDVGGRVVGSGWESPLESAALEGSRFRFDASLLIDGAHRPLTFSGEVKEGTMAGKVTETGSDRVYSRFTARQVRRGSAIDWYR